MGVGVMVTPVPKLDFLRDYVYIPVQMDGKLVGWQARVARHLPREDKKTLRYYLAEGTARSKLLYNFDRARKHPWVCVLEGVTKVWRFGPEAVATFGKVVTPHQADLLARHWRKVVVMLDADAAEEGEKLRQVLARNCKVALVRLLPGQAPDEMTTQEVRRLAFAAAAEAGFELRGQ
jgi:DNA primase